MTRTDAKVMVTLDEDASFDVRAVLTVRALDEKERVRGRQRFQSVITFDTGSCLYVEADYDTVMDRMSKAFLRTSGVE